jgi:hypothetical protein
LSLRAVPRMPSDVLSRWLRLEDKLCNMQDKSRLNKCTVTENRGSVSFEFGVVSFLAQFERENAGCAFGPGALLALS